MKTAPIEDWEIEKARTGARRSVCERPGQLVQPGLPVVGERDVFRRPRSDQHAAERIAKVTAADVQRVAQQYLVKTNRTVVFTMPKPAAPKGGQ